MVECRCFVLGFSTAVKDGVDLYSCDLCYAVQGMRTWNTSRTYIRTHPQTSEHKYNVAKSKTNMVDNAALQYEAALEAAASFDLNSEYIPPSSQAPRRPRIPFELEDSTQDDNMGHLHGISFSAGQEVMDQIQSRNLDEDLRSQGRFDKFGQMMDDIDITVSSTNQYLDRLGESCSAGHILANLFTLSISEEQLEMEESNAGDPLLLHRQTEEDSEFAPYKLKIVSGLLLSEYRVRCGNHH